MSDKPHEQVNIHVGTTPVGGRLGCLEIQQCPQSRRGWIRNNTMSYEHNQGSTTTITRTDPHAKQVSMSDSSILQSTPQTNYNFSDNNVTIESIPRGGNIHVTGPFPADTSAGDSENNYSISAHDAKVKIKEVYTRTMEKAYYTGVHAYLYRIFHNAIKAMLILIGATIMAINLYPGIVNERMTFITGLLGVAVFTMSSFLLTFPLDKKAVSMKSLQYQLAQWGREIRSLEMRTDLASTTIYQYALSYEADIDDIDLQIFANQIFTTNSNINTSNLSEDSQIV